MVVTRFPPDYGRGQNDVLLKAITGLRIEGADVILALSHHEEDVVQISSDVLKALSDYFKTGLSSRWTSQCVDGPIMDNTEHPLTTQRYGLTLDSQCDGCTLVRGVSPYIPKLGLRFVNVYIEPIWCGLDVRRRGTPEC